MAVSLVLVMMALLGIMALTSGCASQTCVVVANQTGIGLVAEYNQQIQSPTGKLGYINSVIGIVPTNRVADDNPESGIGGGAKDSSNVLFETSFSNFFSFWRDNLIYQRVAVGDIAVTQPGAVAMLSKDSTGKLPDADVMNALNGIKAPPKEVTSLKLKLVELGKDEAKRKLILEQLVPLGVANWNAFIDGRPKELNTNQLQKILDEVSK